MNQIGNHFSSIEQITGQYLTKNKTTKAAENYNGSSFEDLLSQAQNTKESSELKFSKHATQRIEDRNIDLSSEQMDRLETAAAKAEEKGIKESLIMVDSLAFIVNIPNNTVVTAIDQQETNNNVFTNIDGAVIA